MAKITRLLIIVFTVAFSAVTGASAQSIICAKKNVKAPRTGSVVKFSSYFSAATGMCPTGYSPIFTEKTGTDSLAELKEVDGTGSGIDADLFDGKTSSDFATATSVDSLAATVATAQSSLDSVTTGVNSAQSSISSLQTSVTSAQSSISTLQSNVTALATETRLPRVVRVAASGGDFTSLASAVASISSPTTNNPAVVLLGPGTFNLASALTIPSGVLIEGAGAGISTISGAVSGATPSDGALLRFSAGAKLKNVSVVNTDNSGGNFVTGITFTDLTSIHADDKGEYATEIDGVKIALLAPEGAGNYGVYIRGSDVRIRRSSISGDNENGFFVGIYLDGFGTACSVYIEESTVFVEGAIAYGLMVNGSSSVMNLIASQVTTNDSAINLSSGGDINIFQSTVIAGNTGLYASGALSKAVVNSSQLSGTPRTTTSSGATITCTDVSSPDGGVATCP